MLRRHSIFKKKLLCFLIVLIILIIAFYPQEDDDRRNYVLRKDILYSLHQATAQNLTSGALVDCDYNDILMDDTILSSSLVDEDLSEGHRLKEGGEYSPVHCKPRFSTAIIVPYRDKVEQLRGFLVYMHNFLRHQRIHYRIFIVEQVDTQPFQRTKLMNIGALYAIKAGYPCLIVQEVDMLPLKPANLYACTVCPRDMSTIINSYRIAFAPPTIRYGLAITTKQFKTINGLSNIIYNLKSYYEDLSWRIEKIELKLCKYDPEINQYHIFEDAESKWDKNTVYNNVKKETIEAEGLNSLQYTEVATVLHPLFTHIMVDLAYQTTSNA